MAESKNALIVFEDAKFCGRNKITRNDPEASQDELNILSDTGNMDNFIGY
jgi:hypothetical protein